MATLAASRSKRLLSSPSTVAHALNWQMNLSRAVLALHFHQDHLELALVAHPGQTKRPVVESLPSLDWKKNSVVDQLRQLVAQHSVCGWVVSGGDASFHPITAQLLNDPQLVNLQRPLCQWPPHSNHPESTHRAASPPSVFRPLRRSFSTTSTTSATHNSPPTEQPPPQQATKDGTTAATVATEYLRTHWPDLTHDNQHDKDLIGLENGEIDETDEDLWTTPPSQDSPEDNVPSPPLPYPDNGEIEPAEESLWTTTNNNEPRQHYYPFLYGSSSAQPQEDNGASTKDRQWRKQCTDLVFF